MARGVLLEHQPKAEEFTDTERTRNVFFNISKDLLQDLANSQGIHLSFSDLNKLATILVRHTIGFGVIEILLQDKNLQDISLNAPIPQTSIFVRHQEFDECITNILPSQEDVDSWAAKFRMISGRPLDESNPILDTQLEIGKVSARIAIIQQPLSPDGLAYAIRRHREQPWTLPLFVKNKMINPFAAGILSFLIDGSRTLLVAGTRSSGKCVDGDTLIQLSDGQVRKIKDLMGNKKREIDDGIICDPISKLFVNSLEGMNLGKKEITDVWKRSSPDKLIKIKTRSGKEIITTREHPYFIYDNGLKNRRADHLNVKNLIACPRELKIFGERQDIDLRNHSYLVDELRDYFVFKGKTNSQLIKFPKKLTPELAEFIGMVVGDGHLDLTKLEFHNSCKELRERYLFLLKMFGVRYGVFNSKSTTVVQVTSRVLNRILRDVFEIPFGKKSDKVVIPQLILKSDNKVLAGFLRGYFDCDGYIPKVKRDIELVSASRDMSEHLRLALLRFGITSFVKPKQINGVFYYRVLIRGKFVNDFAREIGFFHPMKKNRLDLLIMMPYLENTNVDTIPQGNEILRRLRERLRVSPRDLRNFGKDYWSYEADQYRVTRSWFKKLISFYEERFKSICSLKEDVNNLKKIVGFESQEYLSKIERLRQLLKLSYVFLAVDSKFSEAGFRRVLQKRGNIGNVGFLKEVLLLVDKFNSRINELSIFNKIEATLHNLPIFVSQGVVSYAQMSRDLNVPETSLKSYCCGGINAPEDLKGLIESKLNEIKNKLMLDLEMSVHLLNEIKDFSLFEGIKCGFLMSDLRNRLNVSNEEFLSEDVCLQTVSNFFNGVYTPSFKVLQSMAGTITDIFDSVVSDDVLSLINKAKRLADSDIFWDEISSIEEIDKFDDFVYDLTVMDTHNFVANGFLAHNTSLLGSLMLEIMPRYRIIVIEDSLELPVESLRKLKYDILRMKVRSALLKTTTEVSADDGIRTSLRLGDSSLIIGEVRSVEAKALYEAMRVGALANVVAGTIHGASPYGVFDRVVNDLEVPATSFKATDIIAVANPIKSPDGLHSWRRLLQITEIRKHWKKDPQEEQGFVDLLKYNVEKDELEASQDLINGDSEIIKNIAGNVKGWAGNWDAVYDNILLRSKIKKEI
ncbi:MAG: Flp pilus assembly complex ATPase component TadA, partial [Nanoarchaeota archaeon]|nr:Flp pilus assembly complex ATPase component TadA [Nanoarchaeota archaeon]